MQAIILAAGKSTRTYPLTITKPKPLLKVANKTLLEYNLEALDGLVDEVIVVIGYKKEMVIDFVGNLNGRYKFKVRFAEQKKQLGTGHALMAAEKFIKGRFILLMGDNIHSKDDVRACLQYNNSILTDRVENPELFGVIQHNNNILVNIIEKPQLFVSGLVNCAMYVFDKKILRLLKEVKKSSRGEYEIVDAIKQLAMEEDIHCVRSKEWFAIGYPWDLLEADQHFRNKKNSIGANTQIKGEVDNSSVGANCIIDGCVKNSIIMDNTKIGKGSVIEDSVIGSNVCFSGKALSAENVKSIVKNKPVVVARLGAVVGDNVKAEEVVIRPGCKVWPNKNIQGEITGDVE
jgi:NDP-sugar pyrophosphorylase family protein